MKITLETMKEENSRKVEIQDAFNILFQELSKKNFSGELDWLRKPLS